MRNHISSSITSENTQESKNQLLDRNIRVHFIKVVSEVNLLVMCERKLATFISQNLNSLFSSPCIGSKFGHAAVKVMVGCS